LDLVVHVYVCFVLCGGAFRAHFGGGAAAGLAVEMKVDQAKEKMELPKAKGIF
jgi:hypothetical protein